MIFKGEGTWFYFNDDAEDGGVCIKRPNLKEQRAIDKATITKKSQIVTGDGSPPTRLEWIEVNEELRQEMQWDTSIVDWSKVDDGSGELECTKENKIRMMNESVSFLKAVGKALSALGKIEPSDEDLEKN